MKPIFTLLFSALIMSVSAQNFTWTAQTSGTEEWLIDIHFVDNMTGWAVGENGIIVATVDGGETWTTQTSGTTEKLRSVYFLSASRGFAAGDNMTLLTTYDGGAGWAAITHDIPTEESFIKGVQFYDADHGFAITSPHNIFYTSNGGINWEKGTLSSTISSNFIVNDLHVMSDTSAFTAGRYKTTTNNTRPGVFENITNAEGTWIPHGAGNFDTDDELTAIHFTDAQKGFAGGRNGKIYFMEAEGGNFPGAWDVNFATPSASTIYSIDFYGNDYGVFNTAIEVDQQTIQLIYHSANGGENWAAPDSIYGLMSGKLSAGDAQNVWIAGSVGQIYKGTSKSTAVNERFSADLTVMPNPFLSSLMIKSQEAHKGVQLNMFSYTGQLVESVYVADFQYSYELEGLEHLESGVYFLKMKSADGSLNATQKVVKY